MSSNAFGEAPGLPPGFEEATNFGAEIEFFCITSLQLHRVRMRVFMVQRVHRQLQQRGLANSCATLQVSQSYP